MTLGTIEIFGDIFQNEAGNKSDPRMDRFLVLKPVEFLALNIFHYIFVFYLGPKFMQNRKAFSLKKIMVAYNISQIFANAYIFLMICIFCLPRVHSFCYPIDYTNSPENILELHLHHCYLLLKFWDLVETWIYVLRKKSAQVSFLHMYHHTGILVSAWISAKYFPGGQAVYLGLFNTLIHSIMYMYYLTSSLKPVKSIWWKKYITQLQIVQHHLILISLLPAIFLQSCQYPKLGISIFALNTANIIRLFVNFYIKKYGSKSEKVG